jgi:hypothetical protein
MDASMSEVDKFKKDLQRLIREGFNLALAMQKEVNPSNHLNSTPPEDKNRKLPDFHLGYQAWYSEALALLMQVLPERVVDFRSYYSSSTVRKSFHAENYTISDFLRGITSPQVGLSGALLPMFQQYQIIKGLENRFSSTLYDIKTLVHADLLDDELNAADELNENGYQRGAGALAGVALEGHLATVCSRHGITIKKKDPAISDLNDALKSASVIETATWRFVQHLGDLRNKCDHKKTAEPTKVEVTELIAGVRKITKTVL